jgi:hypothetical protein
LPSLAFDGPLSPSFPYGSPHYSSGDLSHTNSSPSLSPLTRDLGNVFLDSEEALPENPTPSIFRNRSLSATEATVAPSDTWRDPGLRPRSASYSTSVTAGARADQVSMERQGDDLTQLSSIGYTLELDPIELDDDFDTDGSSSYGEWGLTSFPNSSFLTSRGGSPAPPSEPIAEPDMSTLFAPVDDQHANITDIIHPKPRRPAPKQPVVLSLDTDMSSLTSVNKQSHYRHRSDSTSLLSAESPADSRHRRFTHRSTLSSPDSRRHSPYPSTHSSPVSASSESQLSPYMPNQEFAALGLTDPSSPLVGHGLHRRNTTSTTRSPTLKVEGVQLQRASSDPSSRRYGHSTRRNVNPRSSSSTSSPLGLDDPSPMMTSDGAYNASPSEESILSDAELISMVPSDNYKPIVASERIVQASNLRRTREARFKCEHEDCTSTFTAKHNLRSAWNSFRLLGYSLTSMHFLRSPTIP